MNHLMTKMKIIRLRYKILENIYLVNLCVCFNKCNILHVYFKIVDVFAIHR
jgi:hypothetical protein